MAEHQNLTPFGALAERHADWSQHPSRLLHASWRKIRAVVLKTHRGGCAQCGDETGPFEVDHIIPRSKGGTHAWGNLQVLCRTCNRRKGAKMIPPVPRNADLRDVRRMPLDVVKLLNTGSWTLATGDEAKAAVTLLAVAWHQVPAGSLPNDERLLAAWSGAGDKWPEVCSMALRGFVECDDGRLYHTVLCDEVERAFHNLEKRRRAATPARKRKQERRVSRIEVA